MDLTRAAVDDVARLGPRRALTGPAARGDWATLGRHRDALAPEERPGYNAGVGLALRLADRAAPAAPLSRRREPAIAEPADGASRRRRGSDGPSTSEDGSPRSDAGDLVRRHRRRRRWGSAGAGRRSSGAAFAAALDAARAAGRPVGLVPTMGALHARPPLADRHGPRPSATHVAVTIFVNPLQFGDPADLERYPRTLAADLAACDAEPAWRRCFAPAGGRDVPALAASRRPPRCRWPG